MLLSILAKETSPLVVSSYPSLPSNSPSKTQQMFLLLFLNSAQERQALNYPTALANLNDFPPPTLTMLNTIFTLFFLILSKPLLGTCSDFFPHPFQISASFSDSPCSEKPPAEPALPTTLSLCLCKHPLPAS